RRSRLRADQYRHRCHRSVKNMGENRHRSPEPLIRSNTSPRLPRMRETSWPALRSPKARRSRAISAPPMKGAMLARHIFMTADGGSSIAGLVGGTAPAGGEATVKPLPPCDTEAKPVSQLPEFAPYPTP